MLGEKSYFRCFCDQKLLHSIDVSARWVRSADYHCTCLSFVTMSGDLVCIILKRTLAIFKAVGAPAVATVANPPLCWITRTRDAVKGGGFLFPHRWAGCFMLNLIFVLHLFFWVGSEDKGSSHMHFNIVTSGCYIFEYIRRWRLLSHCCCPANWESTGNVDSPASLRYISGHAFVFFFF